MQKQSFQQYAANYACNIINTMQTPPLTPAQHSRASERRAIAAGAIRTPGGILPAAAAQSLTALMQAGYAHSKTEAIARALIEAAERQ